ncbi:MAG TPA: FUSC family protein [Ktedonobacteraceae bacterium]
MQETSQQHRDELNRVPQPVRAKQRHDLPGALAGIMKLERLSKADVVYALSLTIASLIAYVITYYVLEPFVNQPNDLLGGMWATVATVFVLREARNLSLRAGLGRLFATCVSGVLTFVYLLLLPFSPVGMAVLIGLGTIIVMLLGRREDVVTTGITTTVIMVVAGLGPASLGWTIPPLRLLDTVIGIVVGVGCWWIGKVLFVCHDQRVEGGESGKRQAGG